MIVFSLNTIVGFACSVGIDMGFNSSHHQEEKAGLTHKGGHQHSKSHHDHNDTPGVHHTSQKSKEDCCKDEVAKFARIDKLAAQSSNFSIQPLIFAAILSSFYHFDVLASYTFIPDNKYFAQSHHPPIPDLRIAIQSFQI